MAEVSPDLVAGADGRPRCPWGAVGSMTDYHDHEWGVPDHGTPALFERISLEAFQSGLSWSTILHKRARFREVFAGFDPAVVAAFGDDERAALMADAGIVRNRAKIDATVANARAVLALEAAGTPLEVLLRSFAPAPAPRPRALADVPARTAESQALAKELKRRGFAFVGPTTAYALMQATGMVDDHLAGCVAPLGRGSTDR